MGNNYQKRKFKVSKCYDVQLEKKSMGARCDTGTRKKTKYYRSIRTWTSEEWEKNDDLGNKKGVYIYIWNGKPIYVGKTMNQQGFSAECFHTHKVGNHSKNKDGVLTKFLKQVNRMRIPGGTLQLQFIYWDGKEFPDTKKKQALSRDISALEKYLIRKSMKVSKYPMNRKDAYPHWSIPGFDGDEDEDDFQNKRNVGKLNRIFEV